jgi:cyclopropane-fatty-acyl-phospholipid synthase
MARDIEAAPVTRDYMFDWERQAAMPKRSRGRAAE